MKKLKINLATYKSGTPILIGIRGENEVRQIDFDIEKWTERYGEGAVTLSVQRNGDAIPYPHNIELSEHTGSWIISSTDTAKEGRGEAQVSYIVDGAVKKSEIIPFNVKRALDNDGEIPDPYTSWLEQIQAIGIQVSGDADAASEYADQARGYASVAKQAVIDTLQFADEGNGEIVITFNTEV